MQVLYEGAVFEIMPFGGVSRYFTELISRLPVGVQPTVLGPSAPPDGLHHPRLQYQGIRTSPAVKFLARAWRPIQHRRISNAIDQHSSQLIHWTYFSGLCKRPIHRSRQPLVVTLYDFIHEAFPDSDPGGKHHRMKVRAIEMADRICCISQATYDELCMRYPLAAKRAYVTPLGSGLDDVAAAALPSELSDRPYLLFVGRRDSYKDFVTLWQAWNNIKAKNPETALVLVGPPMRPREAEALKWDAQDERLKLYVNADDGLLKTLYQHCSAFVFPSRMEGFGLPILEALNQDAPVIASNCAAFREVAGSSAHFFEPGDCDALSDLLDAAASDRLPDQETKRMQGRRQAAQFTWDNTAAKTIEVYRTLSADPLRQVA